MEKINTGKYIKKYRQVRKGNGEYILLEGVHAFKHALRFGAEFEEILISDISQIKNMKKNVLEKNEKNFLLKNSKEIEEKDFEKLIPYEIRSKVLAIVKKPKYILEKISKNKPIIFLENPTNPENIGMVARVCAAFGAGALFVSGRNSVFGASAVRSSEGLVFALPVFDAKNFNKKIYQGRKIIVADGNGEDFKKKKIPKKSVIIFGTERDGVSKNLKKKADEILKIDMLKNISSLNLATSVSAFLYGGDFK